MTNDTKANDLQVGGQHYKDMPLQPWDVMEAVLTPEEFRGFLCGNVIKYTLRAGRKEGSDDAGKAKHYMQKLKEFDEKMHQMRSGKTKHYMQKLKEFDEKMHQMRSGKTRR